jgi:periplasmic protein TonB
MSRTRSAYWNNLERRWASGLLGLVSVISLWLGGCSAIDPQRDASPASSQAKPGIAASITPSPQKPMQPASLASTAKDYRKDAAQHLYALQGSKVFKGRLPPMLYAIGVLNVDIDRQGQIQALKWTRTPQHAPEVVAEIERMVHAAAPFPAPTRLGKVTYTDVWLWDKSGRFQLDTLTEGQD